jgi:hypothetical protein
MNQLYKTLSPRSAAAAFAAAVMAASVVHAAPSAAPGYNLSVFATPLAGSSAPDSIAVVGSHVFIGYGNGGAPDGSGGAMSTIAEYSAGGALLGQTTIVGHNDGLRYDAATGELWAVQNEDANPNLVLINPTTLAKSGALPFSATPHGGGYDDVAFGPGGTFVSASNPASNPNTAPAIVSAALTATQVTVGGVLAANATASVINPPGGSTTLNLQDPDSMIFAPDGKLVLDSQSDHQLVFVSDPGAAAQSVSVLNLAGEVDDTEFTSGGAQRLLVADTGSGTVYALTGPFGADEAISAADALNEIVSVDQSTGAFTPLVSGLDNPHGEALLTAVPEPSEWLLLTFGFGALGAAARRARRAARLNRA